MKFRYHENAGSAICKDKLICEDKVTCRLANKTIPANKLIFYVGIVYVCADKAILANSAIAIY
jgi:hypothetical protein